MKKWHCGILATVCSIMLMLWLYMPAAFAAGEIIIKSDDFSENQASYVMAETNGKAFEVSFESATGTHDTVLVVECPEYGATFSAIPSTGDMVQQVKQLDSHRVAIRLTNSAAAMHYFATFSLSHVKLTDEQSADLIDNNMPTTRIAVTEYQYSGDLANVLTQGTKLAENVYCAPKPATQASEVTETDTYQVSVSSIPALTDYLLDRMTVSGSWWNDQTGMGPHRSAGYRFRFPSAYKEMPVEIVSIKIYTPHSRLKLSRVGANHNSSGHANLLGTASFDRQWTNWQITEGSDTNGSYYLLTPPAGVRLFNNGNIGKDDYFFGFALSWQLVDQANPLDASTAAYTDYQAPDTVLTYRLPGGEEKTKLCDGPLVQTWAKDIHHITNGFNANRNKTTQNTYKSVTVGSYRQNENFVNTANGWYLKTANNVKTEMIPVYLGPVTQTYDFPYQIQPTDMTLGDHIELNQSSPNSVKKNTKLNSITYITLDGVSHQVSQDEIDSINAQYARLVHNGLTCGKITFTEAVPETNPVTKVILKWDSLANEYRFAWHFDGGGWMARSSFSYRVNDWTDATRTQHLPATTEVQVKYLMETNGDNEEPTSYTNDNYLWFRLIPQVDPDLYVQGPYYFQTTGYAYTTYPIDGNTRPLGDMGFQVGLYGERRDTIHDPVIDIWMETTKSPGGAGFTSLTGIDNSQALAFLTGGFTAMPKLAGWYFEYTTKDHGDAVQTYTIAGDIPAEGRAEQIPLAAGDCFTSLRLRYNGDADLSHDSETDTRTVLWLMKGIEYRRLETNPFTGAVIQTAEDYKSASILMKAKVTYDDCICSSRVHANGQNMKVHHTSADFPLQAPVYSTREAFLTARGTAPTEVKTIYQGGTVTSDKWIVSGVPTALFDGYYGCPFVYKNLSFDKSFPWECIQEGIYIELTDPEFMVDIANTQLYSYSITSPEVEYYYQTVAGRRFFVMRFRDGVIRNKNFYTYQNTNTWRSNSSSIGWWSGDPTNFRTDRSSTLKPMGSFQLSLKSLPGTQLGDHHPIGEIYMDFSELLVKYHASIHEAEAEKSGYDNDRTKYTFRNAVEDTLGLSKTAVTGEKLFKMDGSSYTVKVDLSLDAGVEMAPGKYESYDFKPRVTVFRTTEEENLNALVTFEGSGSSDSHTFADLQSVIVLPRAGRTIYWEETRIENGRVIVDSKESMGELDLYLRGAPHLLADSTGANIHYEYTTAADPTAAGMSWSAATPADWKDVTGIRVTLDEIPPQTSCNLRLDLRTDPKYTTRVYHAFGGGTFRYKRVHTDTDYVTGVLPLCEWQYENYAIPSGSVFWDVYDENGVRTTTNTTTRAEALIPGVAVTLYDTDGVTVIDSAVTDSSGKFSIKSYKPDAGQKIEIGMPTVTDGSTPKLTKQSAAVPTNSAVDSDFDRDTHMLTLGTLSANGLPNISAGFVKLPQITATDVTLYAGQSLETAATLTDYLGMNLPADSYNLEFAAAADSAIARVNAKTEIIEETQASDTRSRTTAVTGLRGGQTTATVKTVNRLGDEVTATYTITVKSLPLTISKQVAGVGADEQLAFQFEVTVPSLANQTMMASTGNLVFDADGKVTFALKHGESLTLPQIPYGASYTVTELPVAEYAASAQITGDTLTDDTHDGNAILTGAGVNTIADSWFGPSDRNTVITFTNTHVPTPVEFTVSKVWQDDNNRDGKRPNQVEIILHADNKDVAKATLNAANGWSYTFKDLPKYGSTALITYTASEALPTGYTLTKQESATGAVLTNSYTPGKTSVQVEKIWEDDDNRDNLRPKHVIVELLADGKPVQEMVLEELSNWEGIFNELNAMASGKDIVYTVREKDVPKEYTAAEPVYVNGTWHITNTHKPAATEIQVTKVWDDKDDLAGMRPDSVTLYLNANGTPVEGKEYQLTAKDNWKYTFADLPVYENGKKITYTVTENVKDLQEIGYELETTQGEGTGEVVLTNKYDPEHTSLAVLKVWDDGDDQDGLRPESVTIELLADGEVFQEETLNAEGGWGANISELPKHKDGKEITYTVREKEVPEGYAASSPAYKNGAWHITNAHVPAIISIPVTKEWVDEDDAAKARPEKITVRLHADGIEINFVELTADTEWKTVFDDLPVYKDGDEIVYTITEEHVPGYTHHIDEDTYTITNTYNPTLTDVEVEKTWDMDGHKDVEHPDSVTVRLLADGEDTGITLELNAENKWFGMFEKLELMKDEKPIVYTVEEIEIENFVSEVVVENDYEFLIVNKYVPTEPKPEPEPVPVPTEPPYIYSFTFTKIWQGDTEDSIEWKLYTSDGGAARKSFRKTIISENEWHYEGWFPVDGDYYLIEDVPEGYKVRYENVGVHAGETDRLYNGGTMINYKIPKTGDDANSALWIALAAVSAGALALLWIRRESTHNNL